MIWLTVLAVSFATQSHLDAGLFGLIGFPVIAAVYAWIRRSKDSEADSEGTDKVLPPRMAEFLKAHPEFLNAQKKMRDQAFHKWLNSSELQ